tara:strand:+ start:2424 stop:2723 length:300 start_codon:yes stop_codon:yes gene_type:complete
MNCSKCNNKGHTLEADYQHEVMMRVQCLDCLAHENMKQELSLRLTKVLIDTSQTRMAKLLSDTLIGLIDQDDNPDYERVFALVAAKNKESLISLLQVMA